MLVLINSNRLSPPIAPVGLDYVASALETAGIPTTVIDLGLSTDDGTGELERLRQLSPLLVGITFRNVDDCFWPSATSYVSQCAELIEKVRQATDAPIVVGGVGFSIFGRQLLMALAADFGIIGDGETSLVQLYRALRQADEWQHIPGLVWRGSRQRTDNPAVASAPSELPRCRDHIDNRQYYRQGGQIGIETKRGCPRRCIYCADPLAKGTKVRCRPPELVADEFEMLVAQGIEVFHLCDGEFNIPRAHAIAICEALIRRRLGDAMRFYAYMAVRPFDRELALLMRRAGCAGINFTGDSASNEVLRTYRAAHRPEHLGHAVVLCREVGITCMVDLLIGGPGETTDTVAETIGFLQRIGPDAIGAGIGMRLYPNTLATQQLRADGSLARGEGIKRRYTGPIDLSLPTFYVSPALGPSPASLVRELIGTDSRFFPPVDDSPGSAGDHNYGDNSVLANAVKEGKRGAYWDILRQLRSQP